MKIDCIAIDDEPLALEIISAFASRFPFINLLGTFTNPNEALSFLHNHEIGLLFIDVHLEGMSGIELLQSLSPAPYAILTTGMGADALKSFGLQNAEYLLKPFSFDRFSDCVNRVYKKITNNSI